MPTYEFRCPDGSIIEARFKISEVPENIPTPDGTGVATRIISGGASLLFKGSGFYITDYKTKKGTPHKEGGGEGKAATGESKPAAGTAAAPAKTAPPSSAAAKKK